MTKTRRASFYLKLSLILIACFIIIGYSFYQFKKIRQGPVLEISSPSSTIATTSLTEISGQTKNIQSIFLNGRPIFIDEVGNFSEKLLLSYGYNIIIVSAKDKFGKTVEKKLELVYK